MYVDICHSSSAGASLEPAVAWQVDGARKQAHSPLYFRKKSSIIHGMLCVDICHSSWAGASLEPMVAWQVDGTRELFIKSHSTYGILPYPPGRGRGIEHVLLPIMLITLKS